MDATSRDLPPAPPVSPVPISPAAPPARHRPARRGFLAESAAVTALGLGGALLGAQRASAATAASGTAGLAAQAVGQSPVVTLTPSGDTTGATDVAAINSALTSAAPGAQVWLGAGIWYVDQPINMPPMRVLRGMRAGVAAFDASPGYGTVIRPTVGFTSTFPVSAAIVLLDLQTYNWPQLGQAGANVGAQICDLTIDGSTSPASVDGIAAYGTILGVALTDLAIYNTTGYGIYNAGNPSATSYEYGDGWKAYRVIIQQSGNTAWFHVPGDSTIVDVHAQLAGHVSTPGHGFYVEAGGNTRFIGCRSDLSRGCGWVIDHAGAGDGYTDSTVLTGCGTERNQQHGVFITDGAAAGTDWRDPVVISGCSFDEDGSGPTSGSAYTGGDYAGIWVEGNNRVFISGTTVWVGTIDYEPGCPKYGLATAATGNGNGVPEIVQMSGGHLNYASGGAPVYDGGSNYLYISPDVTSSAGYQTASLDSRLGTAVLSGGTATVSNPWLTSTSRVFLSNTLASGTPGMVYVSSRSSGSFTIKSTSSSDTSRIAWQIVSQ